MPLPRASTVAETLVLQDNKPTQAVACASMWRHHIMPQLLGLHTHDGQAASQLYQVMTESTKTLPYHAQLRVAP